jgi:hypothetical protein
MHGLAEFILRSEIPKLCAFQTFSGHSVEVVRVRQIHLRLSSRAIEFRHCIRHLERSLLLLHLELTPIGLYAHHTL